MKHRILLFLLTLMMLPVAALAQNRPTDRERETWMKEMQQYKTDYMARKLELTEEQKARFAPLYAAMESEVRAVNDQAMKMERDVKKKGDKATDLEREKAAEAQFEIKAREAQIELKYFKEYRNILTSEQLLKFKKAERDFSKELMKVHRDRRSETPATKQTRNKSPRSSR